MSFNSKKVSYKSENSVANSNVSLALRINSVYFGPQTVKNRTRASVLNF